ncbi:hypothetical protein TNCV_3604631 [Trichonephila clavipes]|nr:hypothetical protein TNCV_3604631 [Trichonephila clavipes]
MVKRLHEGHLSWPPPLLTTSPHQWEDVSALHRFNMHRYSIVIPGSTTKQSTTNRLRSFIIGLLMDAISKTNLTLSVRNHSLSMNDSAHICQVYYPNVRHCNFTSTPGVLEFEKPSYTVLENVGTMEIGIVRKEGSDGRLRARYDTKPRTAQPQEDFSPVSGDVIFEPGETRKTIRIPIRNDNVKESSENFEVQLHEPSTVPEVFNFRGLGVRDSVLVTIRDDDSTPGILEFEKPFYTVLENVGAMEIGVVRKEGSDGRIRAKYDTKPKTAQALADFSPVSGEVIFEPGETSKTIRIPIRNDNIKESSESFEVQLHDASAGPEVLNFRGLGVRDSVLVTIRDDDRKNVVDDIAKAATSNPVDPEDHMILTSTKINSEAKELICRTWVVPPVHPWYFQRHPGSAISFKGSRSCQMAFSRCSIGHLSTFCKDWGFPVRRLLHPPAVLRLCTDSWTHGSGLVSLDQMGISPTTTTTTFEYVNSLHCTKPSSDDFETHFFS